MTVYTIHRPSLSSDRTEPMEEFPSVERASVAFQFRCLKQRSIARFMPGPPSLSPVAFPTADDTGLMSVWIRSSTQLPPQPADTPDELWRLTEGGGVRREKWDPEKHRAEFPAPEGGATAPRLDTEHPELREAEKEFVAEEHPGFGAMAIAYWVDGRMELKDISSGRCDCGDDALHQHVGRVQATLMGHAPFNLPPETLVWHVRSGASTADEAKKLARTVAKGLGFTRNPSPVLTESKKASQP